MLFESDYDQAVASGNTPAAVDGGGDMSSISRRSLIGYTGTTAAGAVIAGTASASPAQAAPAERTAQAARTAPAISCGVTA
jgi:hypothetical protein